jgi:hypothetical protein
LFFFFEKKEEEPIECGYRANARKRRARGKEEPIAYKRGKKAKMNRGRPAE